MKVIIACGGTGGHIFPAISLAEELRLKRPDIEIMFAGNFKEDILTRLLELGYQAKTVSGAAMPYNPSVKFVPFFFHLFRAISRSTRLLGDFRPDAVVSMGSFSGGPFVLAAYMRQISTLIHEQNVMPGRANSFSCHFADRIAVSFAQTQKFLSKAAQRKSVITGNPVRSEILKVNKRQAFDKLGLADGKFTILVTGGSQGSHSINRVFIEAVKSLNAGSFQVIHLTGSRDFDFVSAEYKRLAITNKALPFLDRIGDAYACCDLVISRAGATTVAEITALGLASILVPYPYGDYHQRKNALVLEDRGAALIIEERDLTKELLLESIQTLAKDNQRIQAMREKSKQLGNYVAAANLAEEVLKL